MRLWGSPQITLGTEEVDLLNFRRDDAQLVGFPADSLADKALERQPRPRVVNGGDHGTTSPRRGKAGLTRVTHRAIVSVGTNVLQLLHSVVSALIWGPSYCKTAFEDSLPS